eukprot:1732324-Rhodomonas_salina.3
MSALTWRILLATATGETESLTRSMPHVWTAPSAASQAQPRDRTHQDSPCIYICCGPSLCQRPWSPTLGNPGTSHEDDVVLRHEHAGSSLSHQPVDQARRGLLRLGLVHIPVELHRERTLSVSARVQAAVSALHCRQTGSWRVVVRPRAGA